MSLFTKLSFPFPSFLQGTAGCAAFSAYSSHRVVHPVSATKPKNTPLPSKALRAIPTSLERQQRHPSLAPTLSISTQIRNIPSSARPAAKSTLPPHAAPTQVDISHPPLARSRPIIASISHHEQQMTPRYTNKGHVILSKIPVKVKILNLLKSQKVKI